MNKFVAIIFIFWCITACDSSNNKTLKKTHAASVVNIDTSDYSLNYLESLHRKRNFKRYDKSLTEFILSNPNKRDSVRKIIYLQPLGNMSDKVAGIIKEEINYLKSFFQLEVKILGNISFEEIKNRKVETRLVSEDDLGYYNKFKSSSVNLTEQINANSLIENYLKNNVPTDAVAVLGITEHDLYLPRMNFIYGSSYLKNRMGIISTYRIAEDYEESKMNIRKVVTKQIANLFSIPNVKDYVCVLNFHNNIEQLRAGTLLISPVALAKLKYAIGFDYTQRFSDLKEFYHSEGNEAMEEYYDKSLKLIATQVKSKK
ncbi:archaemetzincin [Sporocytophaga myxococcoides]|uniref:archaemetzincin n=1 Tax=Sporocytophaga myxococcoides TaxID=153721 RepID=UPI0004082043|nr:archaemetzincin [Sporocytophaga myxococcoides]